MNLPAIRYVAGAQCLCTIVITRFNDILEKCLILTAIRFVSFARYVRILFVCICVNDFVRTLRSE